MASSPGSSPVDGNVPKGQLGPSSPQREREQLAALQGQKILSSTRQSRRWLSDKHDCITGDCYHDDVYPPDPDSPKVAESEKSESVAPPLGSQPKPRPKSPESRPGPSPLAMMPPITGAAAAATATTTPNSPGDLPIRSRNLHDNNTSMLAEGGAEVGEEPSPRELKSGLALEDTKNNDGEVTGYEVDDAGYEVDDTSYEFVDTARARRVHGYI
ncbi:hypothetical protein B0T26DRAFT_871992 [Lasiosphaeria miniovina]|uniref:Uncharacterized protein n=1 Tax=Lasiosphaeria miniovina TaxID=1954250 RepID=A0AA40DYD8_9PEZI|nr:uncharacterized protein B0T26DRAFT_871992 [Lasiosphaeria miniovina]KAK0717546.1 hypothetical protein B0T26DRAFT_871992 [Lasiosphaeria miniovina]